MRHSIFVFGFIYSLFHHPSILLDPTQLPSPPARGHPQNAHDNSHMGDPCLPSARQYQPTRTKSPRVGLSYCDGRLIILLVGRTLAGSPPPALPRHPLNIPVGTKHGTMPATSALNGTIVHRYK